MFAAPQAHVQCCVAAENARMEARKHIVQRIQGKDWYCHRNGTRLCLVNVSDRPCERAGKVGSS